MRRLENPKTSVVYRGAPLPLDNSKDSLTPSTAVHNRIFEIQIKNNDKFVKIYYNVEYEETNSMMLPYLCADFIVKSYRIKIS